MQFSGNFSSLNEDGQYTRFYQGLRPTIDALEQELDLDGHQSESAPLSCDIPSEKLYGQIKIDNFKKILDSYEQCQGNKQSPEDIVEQTVSCDTDTYKNFAQLLHSKPSFHHPGSTDYLIKDLQITNLQRLSLLGHSFGVSNFRFEEAENLEELLKKRRNEMMKDNLIAAHEYLDKQLYKDAWREIELALKIDSKNGNALATRGRYFLKSHKHQQAIDDYRNALKANSDDKRQVERELAKALEQLGEIHFHKHEYSLAKDKFTEALELGSENPDLTTLHRNICEDKIKFGMKQSPFGPIKEAYRK